MIRMMGTAWKMSAFPVAALANVAWTQYAGRRIAERVMTDIRVRKGTAWKTLAYLIAVVWNVAWTRCAGRRIAERAGTGTNVWEWVSDWYDSGYYSNSPVSDPTGPDSSSGRVWRGGGFLSYFDVYLRASDRLDDVPSAFYDILGFRCARDAM